MTLDEAIKMYTNNAECERTHGSLQGCLDFRQLAEWLKELKRLREVTPQPKNGCEGCKFEKTGNNSTYPCSHCSRCYTDKYRGESEE